MLETHPFGSFVPPSPKYLLLGSFTTKEAYAENTKATYQWFYANGRNQLWPIMERVYGLKLPTRKDKETLFTALNMALGDIIYQCVRRKNSNLDIHLTDIVYALDDISKILETNFIQKIFFTSRFVESKYRTKFKHLITNYPDIELVTLPSPSPRYASLSLKDKIAKYESLLPHL